MTKLLLLVKSYEDSFFFFFFLNNFNQSNMITTQTFIHFLSPLSPELRVTGSQGSTRAHLSCHWGRRSTPWTSCEFITGTHRKTPLQKQLFANSHTQGQLLVLLTCLFLDRERTHTDINQAQKNLNVYVRNCSQRSSYQLTQKFNEAANISSVRTMYVALFWLLCTYVLGMPWRTAVFLFKILTAGYFAECQSE